jgi:hypothetical protein
MFDYYPTKGHDVVQPYIMREKKVKRIMTTVCFRNLLTTCYFMFMYSVVKFFTCWGLLTYTVAYSLHKERSDVQCEK